MTTDIRTKKVVLVEDGGEVDVYLKTPTPFAMEQYLRNCLAADLDMNTITTPYLDPDVILLRDVELKALPRDKRRTAEVKAKLAESAAEVAKVTSLSQDELAAARKYAAQRRAEAGLERMVIVSSMLAALLSDASPHDENGRPTRVYSREEAMQMIPIGKASYDAVFDAVFDLWPDEKATPPNPSSGEATS